MMYSFLDAGYLHRSIIRDDEDCAAHMDYIHFNPVKHGLTARPADWSLSSFAKCAARGFYPIDRAIQGRELADMGERV